jgi:hypothetical protein
MTKDTQRRELILHALQESRLEALASFFLTEVLLLTGYWPVGFTGADGNALPGVHPNLSTSSKPA